MVVISKRIIRNKTIEGLYAKTVVLVYCNTEKEPMVVIKKHVLEYKDSFKPHDGTQVVKAYKNYVLTYQMIAFRVSTYLKIGEMVIDMYREGEKKLQEYIK